MKNYFCTKAGHTPSCGDCRHNPRNQGGQPRNAPLNPSIRDGMKCGNWSAVRSGAITPSQTR